MKVMTEAIDYIDINPVYSEVLKHHAKKCKEFLTKPVKEGNLYKLVCQICGEVLFNWKGEK